MSAYLKDPRVTVDQDGLLVVDGPDSDSGSQVTGWVTPCDDGFRAWFDGMAGSPQMTYPSLDAAIRSMVGDPR